MSFTFSKRKTAAALFISAVIILLTNLVLDKFFLTNPPVPAKSGLTSVETDSLFKSALFNLGIKENWIIKKNEELKVIIPEDLPAVLVLQEINYVFDDDEIRINSFEKKIGGSTLLSLFSDDEEILKAELVYSDTVKRKSVRVGFIVERSEQDTESDSLIINYPEQLAVLIIPSDNSAEYVKRLTGKGKEYIVLLNDEIKELKYKLSPGYSERRLKNSIREIVGKFPGAVFFLSDSQSLLYNSEIYSLIKAELEKRKIKLFIKDQFAELKAAEDEDVSELFNNYLSNAEGGEDKLIIVSAEKFLQLNSVISRFRKLGYKFTNPSVLIK